MVNYGSKTNELINSFVIIKVHVKFDGIINTIYQKNE